MTVENSSNNNNIKLQITQITQRDPNCNAVISESKVKNVLLVVILIYILFKDIEFW